MPIKRTFYRESGEKPLFGLQASTLLDKILPALYTCSTMQQVSMTLETLWNSHLPIVIVGPTASGKTAVAVELAVRMGAEIINADSMQIYTGMDVGTAKPTPRERERASFHLLDIVEPDRQFSVAEWKNSAETAFETISRRGKRVIICGGTGLYVRALLEDWTLAQTPENPEVREALRAELKQLGADVLYERLQSVDPATAGRLHPNDGVRIVRALEVFQITGKPISLWQAEDKQARTLRPAHYFGLSLPRPELYARIDARVDAMIAQGLEEEVKTLQSKGYPPLLSALKSLGYREILAYLNGETDKETAIATIKQNTRQYAKRQLTWFRADKRITWVEVAGMSAEEIATLLQQKVESHPFGAL